jgi:regulator of protease activity HflC (stomatin/prohibitin superfamily)
MDVPTLLSSLPVLAVLGMVAMRSFRQINQWETGLKFTLGKYTGKMEPGLNLLLPMVQTVIRVDMRTRNRDLPQQMVITRDNVTAMIDAVVYFRVIDPEKAALNVENFELAVKDRAKVVLRDVVGETPLDELLTHRDAIAARVRDMVEQFVSKWGIHLELIALQDIQLPPTMQEAIAKKALAERDKQAVIIKSQADLESAANFAEAARILTNSPGAMELRRLEALQNMTVAGNSRVIFDLAKPYGNDSRSESAAMGAAMAEESQKPRKRVDVPLAKHTQQQIDDARVEEEAAAVVAASAEEVRLRGVR